MTDARIWDGIRTAKHIYFCLTSRSFTYSPVVVKAAPLSNLPGIRKEWERKCCRSRRLCIRIDCEQLLKKGDMVRKQLNLLHLLSEIWIEYIFLLHNVLCNPPCHMMIVLERAGQRSVQDLAVWR
jgi:hypothetical protein